MIRKFSPLVGSTALLLVSACGGGSDATSPSASVKPGGTFACTAESRAGIVIQVIDSASGNPMSCGERAVVTDGTYSETVDSPSSPWCSNTTSLAAAFERAGTYSITVSKAGYRDFTINGVVVTRDVCHVKTVTVEAQLSPT